MRKHLHKIGFLLSILLTVSFSLPSPVSAQSGGDLTRIEQWVLDQSLIGEEADLEKAPFPNDHVLRVAFLERLLYKQFKDLPSSQTSTRYRIHIRHAIFTEALAFQNMEVPYDVRLANCQFKDTVDFSESSFDKDLTLNGSTFDQGVNFYELAVGKDLSLANVQFKNSKQVYNFRSMNVDNFVFIEQAVFAGRVDFSYTEVGNNFEAEASQFNYEGDENDKPNSFESMKVGGSAFFNPISINGEIRTVTFRGPVSFADVEVGHRFEAMGAQFNSTKLANFRHIKVDGTFTLNAKDYGEKSTYKTTFDGPVDFRYSEIGVNFEADDAQFTDDKEEAIFWNLNVGNAIFMRRVSFAGPVNFQKSIIDGDFSITNAQFLYKGALQNENGEPKTIYFGNMKVGGAMLVSAATFAGPVDFRYTQVETNFEANGSQFNYNGEISNDFSSMKIGGSALFNNVRLKDDTKTVTFAGSVKFDDLQAGRTFEANGAHFKSEKLASFQHMKVDGATLLDDITFEGPVDFRYSEIKTNFEAGNAQFNGPINFNHIKVGDSIRLIGTQFKGPVELKGSDCGTLYLQDVTWPLRLKPGVSKVDISGMTYKSIEGWRTRQDNAGHKMPIESWQDLKWLVEQSPYNAQTYTTLENFFSNAGHPERADEVYVAYKRRETQTLKDAKQGLWIWNWFLDKFVRFGRRPGQAWVWSLAIIVLGAIVFWKREEMVDVSKKDFPQSEKDVYPYNPFWYSLDLFVDLVDLGFESRWAPKPGRKAAFIYSKFHKMAGWVLITIAVLTVTGLIK